MSIPFLEGLGTGGSLIVAIGAQNAFVLTQGIRRQHHMIIALICSLIDATLITAGVAGLGAAIAASPTLRMLAAWGGAAFLVWYGTNSFISAYRGQGQLQADDGATRTLKASIAFTLAVSLLNPHVYIDTVILLGGISAQLPESERYLFGAGACCASVLWFFSLSLGGQAIAPVMQSRRAWQIADTIIGLIMWTAAWGLIRTVII